MNSDDDRVEDAKRGATWSNGIITATDTQAKQAHGSLSIV